MSGEEVLFFYFGAVSAIWLLNAVRWSFSPSWIDGLFTLLVLISFAQSIYFALFAETVPLPKAGYLIIHSLHRGLIKIIFLELIYLLFNGANWSSLAQRRWRWGQVGLTICMLINVGLFSLSDENWYRSVAGHIVSGVYWCLMIGISVMGIGIAARRKDAIGKTFIMGSVFMLLSELNVLVYALLHRWPFPDNVVSIDLQRQLLWGERILELLSFSLCLVFYQRYVAVTKAVEQTQLAEQIKQERLEAELAMQRLEQEKTNVQLRALQAQVNPHFLFNSLNSLSALIDDDQGRASHFVDQLSQVYRYLLRTSNQALTTLASELDFIESYYHLLKTRHGSGLTLTVQVNPAYQAKLLPPFTLQLLVENAVKHNIVLANEPLRINIVTDDAGYLVVSNNLQRKRTPVLSNGVGLSTILAQYQKLDQLPPDIIEGEGRFTVRLPLIESLSELAPQQ
ncbi:sensor histidine kinase [Spirosoma sp. KCTC 42546]|uniref:sensor histidine kinase n=1 Tax=Spirosoma sp. KCTC 42546 TaxID=2520506 RepID=UPI001FF01C1C|nr:histidine kinase [Spirosoma sp. KCTC 42546]